MAVDVDEDADADVGVDVEVLCAGRCAGVLCAVGFSVQASTYAD